DAVVLLVDLLEHVGGPGAGQQRLVALEQRLEELASLGDPRAADRGVQDRLEDRHVRVRLDLRVVEAGRAGGQQAQVAGDRGQRLRRAHEAQELVRRVDVLRTGVDGEVPAAGGRSRPDRA